MADRGALSRFRSQGASSPAIRPDAQPPAGLVQASELRKRRLNTALGDAFHSSSAGSSRGSTPHNDSREEQERAVKRVKKAPVRPQVKLSFAQEEEADGEHGIDNSKPSSESRQRDPSSDSTTLTKPRLMTKAALAREAAVADALRKQFLHDQELVRATEIAIPYVFYDDAGSYSGATRGTSICRMKKGDQVWLFLDKARKAGAMGASTQDGRQRTAASGMASKGGARKDWARIGVDDLMMIRGEVIIPPHFELYYFILKKTRDSNGGLLFNYSDRPRVASTGNEPESSLLKTSETREPVEELEGADHDPTLTKVVDRAWYEKYKHIFPASQWTEFDSEKDYAAQGRRRDRDGNAFFFG